MYAAAERPEVTFVFNELGLESSLGQVPCPRVSFGIPICVATEQVSHPTRQVGPGLEMAVQKKASLASKHTQRLANPFAIKFWPSHRLSAGSHRRYEK